MVAIRDRRHRRERGDAFLVFVRLGKSEQRGFVQFAGVMQAEDRALRRREIAAYFRLFWRADDLDHRLVDRGLLVGLCHLEQAAAHDVGRAGQKLLQLRRAEIVALADR